MFVFLYLLFNKLLEGEDVDGDIEYTDEDLEAKIKKELEGM